MGNLTVRTNQYVHPLPLDDTFGRTRFSSLRNLAVGKHLIKRRKESVNLASTLGELGFTNLAANATNTALLAHLAARFMTIAFDDIFTIFVDHMHCIGGANLYTFLAADALLLINYDIPILVLGDSPNRTNFYTRA